MGFVLAVGGVGGVNTGLGAVAAGAGGVAHPITGVRLKAAFSIKEAAFIVTAPFEFIVTVAPSITFAPDALFAILAAFTLKAPQEMLISLVVLMLRLCPSNCKEAFALTIMSPVAVIERVAPDKCVNVTVSVWVSTRNLLPLRSV